MASSLKVTSAVPDPALLDLPWGLPLELWPEDVIAALPKGISRHLVRFVHLSGQVIAIKETSADLAQREYDLLRALRKSDIPCVTPLAVVTGRGATAEGEELTPALVTRHLKFSLPYRAIYSQTLRPDTATRLVDALALLLTRLHMAGFFWGDVSLSNTLFRRDAGAFAAYLVDAETGDLHDGELSSGQREHDLEIGRINIAGELLDLQAGGRLDDVDPIAIADGIVSAYRNLWSELTESESFPQLERWRINQRVERLNALGFDIGELSIGQDEAGTQVRIQPKVVDAGHHCRRLLRLTGLDAGENQARRLLNDLDAYRATGDRKDLDEEMVAHEWLVRVFEPVIRSIPKELKGKLEPAEVFHQLLDHRWYLSQNQNRNVPLAEALTSYIDDVLRHRRDEVTVVGPPTGAITAALDTIDDDDWRSKV